MTLHLIGTGLWSIRDLSVRAKEVIDACTHVYLEHYTSILKESKKEIETFLGKQIILAPREMIEQNANTILAQAKTADVALLVVGDVFGATTHTDLLLRAHAAQVKTHVLHNASILTAVGITGLELYKFGKTTSMVFFDDDWKPQTAYDVIKDNQTMGLHTLILLDIKVAEPAKKDIRSEKHTPLPSRFMTINQAIAQLHEIEQNRSDNIFTPDTLCVGVARLGSDDPCIISGNAAQLADVDFGEPLHALIIPGKLHFMEEDALKLYQIGKE